MGPALKIYTYLLTANQETLKTSTQSLYCYPGGVIVVKIWKRYLPVTISMEDARKFRLDIQ